MKGGTTVTVTIERVVSLLMALHFKLKRIIEMVMARLHIICGNCGCNSDHDNFTYNHEEYPSDAEETKMQYETTIVCNNCSTIHWLNENAVNKNAVREKAN